jgi:hypothetical protein
VVTKRNQEKAESLGFLEILENGVRDVLKDPEATAAEKMAAISAGSKLLMIRNKIGDAERGFFE